MEAQLTSKEGGVDVYKDAETRTFCEQGTSFRTMLLRFTVKNMAIAHSPKSC